MAFASVVSSCVSTLLASIPAIASSPPVRMLLSTSLSCVRCVTLTCRQHPSPSCRLLLHTVDTLDFQSVTIVSIVRKNIFRHQRLLGITLCGRGDCPPLVPHTKPRYSLCRLTSPAITTLAGDHTTIELPGAPLHDEPVDGSYLLLLVDAMYRDSRARALSVLENTVKINAS